MKASNNSLGFGRGRDGRIPQPWLPGRGRGTGVVPTYRNQRPPGAHHDPTMPRMPPARRASSYDGRLSLNNQSHRSSDWFCLTVGETRLGPKEAEFCTKLPAAYCVPGRPRMQIPLANKHVRSPDEAFAEINSVLSNPKTQNVKACLIITKQALERAFCNVFDSFLGQIQFFVLDEVQVNKCLCEPDSMVKTAQRFSYCLFPSNNESQRQLSSSAADYRAPPGSSSSQSSDASAWLCISIGGWDLNLLRDFCSHFSRAVRAKSFDLKDALECRCVSSTSEAVRTLSDLLRNPRTQAAVSCIIFTTGNFRQTKFDLMRAFGHRLWICVFGENRLRQWYYDDASLGVLITDFTTLCKIQRKESAIESESTTYADTTVTEKRNDASVVPLGLAKLTELCNRLDNKTLPPSSSELVQKLTVDGSFYKRIEVSAQSDTPPHVINMILKLVAAACSFNSSQFRENVNELLQQFINSPDFLRQATDKCIYVLLEDQDLNQVEPNALKHMQATVKDHLFVLWLLLDRFPSSHRAVSGSVSSALLILKQDSLRDSPFYDQELNDRLEQLEVQWKFARTRIKQPEPTVTAKHNPPQDYRNISVCPTKDDILNAPKPFLRGNIAKGAYEDSEHYLDVQFRLLREDFIGPLRDGIRHFLSGQTRRIGVYIYRQVQVQPPTTDKKTGILSYPVTFAPMRYARWMKRLKYGSLVCLSADNFKNDLLFATVAKQSLDLFSTDSLDVISPPFWNANMNFCWRGW